MKIIGVQVVGSLSASTYTLGTIARIPGFGELG
jgi:hypothetical protein